MKVTPPVRLLPVTDILWHSLELHSPERCTLADRPGGHVLTGVVVVPINGQPADLRYQVAVDPRWRTRNVEIVVTDDGGERRIAMSTDAAGHWLVNGQAATGLNGCTDVDLGWTPATNTLPMRRLNLQVGETASITAAWVRFPELVIEPSVQTYDRLDEWRWRYSSGAFAADLKVDPECLVLRYGAKLWTAVAHSDPAFRPQPRPCWAPGSART
ncbi:MAG: hypothetical protein GEU81_15355 [Nitriliruptorales bacterium]|nr:hypothetical protein [Nitriliruptorales bacterium]